MSGWEARARARWGGSEVAAVDDVACGGAGRFSETEAVWYGSSGEAGAGGAGSDVGPEGGIAADVGGYGAGAGAGEVVGGGAGGGGVADARAGVGVGGGEDTGAHGCADDDEAGKSSKRDETAVCTSHALRCNAVVARETSTPWSPISAAPCCTSATHSSRGLVERRPQRRRLTGGFAAAVAAWSKTNASAAALARSGARATPISAHRASKSVLHELISAVSFCRCCLDEDAVALTRSIKQGRSWAGTTPCSRGSAKCESRLADATSPSSRSTH